MPDWETLPEGSRREEVDCTEGDPEGGWEQVEMLGSSREYVPQIVYNPTR